MELQDLSLEQALVEQEDTLSLLDAPNPLWEEPKNDLLLLLITAESVKLETVTVMYQVFVPESLISKPLQILLEASSQLQVVHSGLEPFKSHR